MEEDNVTWRLKQIEANVMELKSNDKEQLKCMAENDKLMAKELGIIKLGNAEMKVIFKEVKATSTYIKNSVIGFIIFSVLTYIIAMYGRYLGPQ